jgi:hypothetical protein
MRKSLLWFIVCVLAPLSFTGCVSLMEKTGKALDGSAFAEKKVAVYRTAGMELQEVQNKAGERSFFIVLRQFPAIKIRGSAPNEEGEFYLTSLDYLGGNTHGWNEYRLDLSGYGKLALNETTAVFSVSDEIEAVQISAGRIRRYDTRITGNDALTNLRNRRERIVALTEWMNAPSEEVELSEEAEPAEEDGLSEDGGGRKETAKKETTKSVDRVYFELHWKPLLFPELVSKKKRPGNWQQEGDKWVRAEDIRWNASYTERTFPEELRVIRDSGTMLRDWEEALEWIYMEYEWGRITALLAQETVLNRVKK